MKIEHAGVVMKRTIHSLKHREIFVSVYQQEKTVPAIIQHTQLTHQYQQVYYAGISNSLPSKHAYIFLHDKEY